MNKLFYKSSFLTFGLFTFLIFGSAVFAQTKNEVINFDTDKKSIGGNGGCNGFGGNLSVNGSEIKISQIISTQMFCEDTSDVENKFLRNLERATKYKITGGKLVLFDDDKIILEFIPKN